MLRTGEKQWFLWTNKMMNELISRLEDFKALIGFQSSYFDGDRQTQYSERIMWKHKSFGTEKYLKTAIDTDKTDFMAKQTLCITFEM